MMNSRKPLAALVSTLVVSSLLVLSACGGDDAATTVTLSGKSAVTGATAGLHGDMKLMAALSTYKMYCVTFAATPTAATAAFGADGSWALDLPANTPFGCFINDANNKVACVVTVEDTAKDMNGAAATSSSISLAGSVALTTGVDCDPAKGVATIKKTELAAGLSTTVSGLDLAAVHDSEFSIHCIDTDATILADCIESMQDGGANGSATAYGRILKGTFTPSGGAAETVLGAGFWRSHTSWVNCGSKDIPTAYAQGGTLALTQGTVGNWVTTTGGGICDVRDYDNDGRPKNLYVLEKLSESGGAYSFTQNESYSSGGCTSTYTSAISFAADSTGTYAFVGSFNNAETFTNCGTETNRAGSFRVGFKAKSKS